MTENAPQNFPPWEASAGTAGAGPALDAGRSGTSPGRPQGGAFRPRLGSFGHGILSQDTDGAWTRDAQAWYLALCDEMGIENRSRRSVYRASMLPRIEAIRNLGRSSKLTRDMISLRLDLAEAADARLRGIDEDHATHSNGAVLAVQSLWQRSRDPDSRWLNVNSLTMVAPACATRKASERVGEMLRSGFLRRAVLVRCHRDRVLSFVSRRRLATWPWGSLGLDGWDLDAMGEVPAGSLVTVDLPEARHSDPLRPGNRQHTFDAIFGPAMGLMPWPANSSQSAGIMMEGGPA